MDVITCQNLPEDADTDHIYHLTPVNPDPAYYTERTDRNIGWISREEQDILKRKTVGISGCGGMGGLIASILIRAGVGTVKIADVENFDASNINRQFGATRANIGISKAFATARALRAITDDTNLIVYPRGINEADVDHFLQGCDVVCDEIEFWMVGARILLHQQARKAGVPLFNCNTIGFGTRLFFFTPQSATMEECLGLNYAEAKALEEKMIAKTADPDERRKIMENVAYGLLPELPTYSPLSAPCGNFPSIVKRMKEEGKAPIIASNPPMASGFVSDHVLLYLLKDSGVERHITHPAPMPSYLYFDAAKMRAKQVKGIWWNKGSRLKDSTYLCGKTLMRHPKPTLRRLVDLAQYYAMSTVIRLMMAKAG